MFMLRPYLLSVVAALAWVSVGHREAVAQAHHDHQSQGATHCATVAEPECPIDAFLLSILRTGGVTPAMASLDSLAAVDDDIRRDGHNYAHMIGIAAFTGDEEVGTVFSRCTPAFQSGCYHGVIQAFFTAHLQEHGSHLDEATVNALCRTQREDETSRWLLFQCAHGMGHGMMMLAGNHLPTALEACDMVSDPWERESCYGGVFMENIVHATTPEHSPGRPATEGGGDHAHHGVPAVSLADPSRVDFPALKRDEPLYPCNVLPDRYLVACYQMQTSAVMHHNRSDVSETVAVCTSAPEAYRTICFQSLGRDISSITLQDHDRAVRLCSMAPAVYQPWCNLGYTKNLVDVTADPEDGFAYCRLLPDGESKRVCNIAVGEQIWVLTESPEQREAMCAAAEAAYLDSCRHGAGLVASTPGAMTPPSNGSAPRRE